MSGQLPYKLWNAIDEYVAACGGDPGKFSDGTNPNDPDCYVTTRLREELREWALAEITKALKGET